MESYRLNGSQEYTGEELRYLSLLSKSYPSIQTASNEIINLKAILNLPKGTEHFFFVIHGEYEAFLHMLRNASGVIKTKVDEAFGTTLRQEDRQTLATLIYYPKEKLEIIKKQVANLNDWYRITLYRLVEICRNISSKYTRSKVRQALPKEFEFVIDELIHGYDHMPNQNEYYQQIIDTIIEIDRADAFITALSQLIQRLAIDHLHIIGDVYDRGPGAHIILDELMKYHSVDIQWGNHDILWMGAAAGNAASIANVIRICARYNNLDTLEDGYGISLRPLALFAQETYKEDPCGKFFPEILGEKHSSERDLRSIARIHKAITIIQLKLEGQIMGRRDDFQMRNRSFLENMNLEDGVVTVEGHAYPLIDTYFPTWDAQSPLVLSAQEQEVVDRLVVSFSNNERLQTHARFLFSKGSMYTAYNSNLLYHGCIPMEQNGEFSAVALNGQALKGKALLDSLEQTARQGYFAKPGRIQKQNGLDTLWYLWCGAKSPLFGKSKMTTFERYFLNEPDLNEEGKDPYYKLVDDEETCRHILEEFGLDPETSHIINGHVPVKVKKGESPIKGGGKLLIIDGGLSRAYHEQTGIAGYTLIYNSQGMSLSAHEPFESTAKAIEEEKDIHSKTIVLERRYDRQMVKDTDNGRILKERIHDLERLLWAYRLGLIKEQA